jgi:hypothetical protein
VSQRSNDSLRATVDCRMNSKSEQCATEQQSQRAPDCPVQQDDRRLQRSTAQNPNGYADVACIRQCTVSVRCVHRQQPLPTASKWLGAINTPNHHILLYPSFLKITFNTRALAFTLRHNSKDQILSKSQIHLKHLVTCEKEILCSFALLLLGLPCSFLISFLK